MPGTSEGMLGGRIFHPEVLPFCATGITFAALTTISLKLPDELAARLEAEAQARNTSRSTLFREALEEKLEALAAGRQPSLLELASDLCGSAASGFQDLGSNPKHLEGFGA